MWSLLSLGCVTGELGGLVATPNALVPTSVDVRWDILSPAGKTFVEYGESPDVLDHTTPAGTGASATVLGLAGGQRWWIRAVDIDADGVRWESETVELEIDAPPASLPTFTVDEVDESQLDPDSVVFTTLLQADASWIIGLDRQGRPIWWLQPEGDADIPSLTLSADGTGLVYLHQEKVGDLSHNGVYVTNFAGTSQVLTPGADGHHAALQLPDGSLAWIASEVRGVVTENDGTQSLSADTIEETAYGALFATDARTRFSVLDDEGHQPWRMCAHFDEEGPGGGLDYTHGNSLMFDEQNEAYLYMSKNLDALLSVDRASGQVRWQAGGRYSTLRDADGDPTSTLADDVDGPNGTWWSHGHMSEAWADGFLVFDNGYHHADRRSRAVEYALDPEEGTVQKVWEHASPFDEMNPLLGDVRRMPNGDRLISWTLQGTLDEVTPEGVVVWRASAALGSATGRVLPLASIYVERR